jgi:hypothetical protein
MKVRLTRKHAGRIDGIDLSDHEVGDIIDLSPDEARLIVAEEWAHLDRRIFVTATQHERRAEDQQPASRSQDPEEERATIAAERAARARKAE